jgi:hypothetical protein
LLPFPSMEKIWDWNPLLESPKVCTNFKWLYEGTRTHMHYAGMI